MAKTAGSVLESQLDKYGKLQMVANEVQRMPELKAPMGAIFGRFLLISPHSLLTFLILPLISLSFC